jgi:hypothetical protein
MVDPTSDLAEDVDEEDAPRCATCGTPVLYDPGHRTVSWVADGRVRHRHFCSEAHREEWLAENDVPG